MDKFFAAQTRLKTALFVLIDDDDYIEKYLRVYAQCVSPVTEHGIPGILHKDYFRLISLFTPFLNRVCHGPLKSSEDSLALIGHIRIIAPAILHLLVSLSEWIAGEKDLMGQRRPHR